MIVTTDEIDAFWHCSDALCPSHSQQPTRAYRETISITFGDRGADPNYMDTGRVESSTSTLRPVNPDERACPTCANPRELADQIRPRYRNISGQDPLFLVRQLARERAMMAGEDAYAPKDDRLAELERLNAELAERLAKIEGNGHEPAPKPTRAGRAPA